MTRFGQGNASQCGPPDDADMELLMERYAASSGQSGASWCRLHETFFVDDPNDSDLIEVYSRAQVCDWVVQAIAEYNKEKHEWYSEDDLAAAVVATAPGPMLRMQFGF